MRRRTGSRGKIAHGARCGLAQRAGDAQVQGTARAGAWWRCRRKMAFAKLRIRRHRRLLGTVRHCRRGPALAACRRSSLGRCANNGSPPGCVIARAPGATSVGVAQWSRPRGVLPVVAENKSGRGPRACAPRRRQPASHRVVASSGSLGSQRARRTRVPLPWLACCSPY